MRIRTLLILALLIIVAACSSGDTTTTPDVRDSSTTSVEEGSTSTSAELPPSTSANGTTLQVTDCDDATDEFKSFCDTYSLIRGHFVDDVDDSDLVAGALESLQTWDLEDGTGAPSNVTCSVPNDAFESFCDSLVEELESQDASLEEVVEAAIAGMVVGLDDPYSVYLSPVALANFRIDTSGSVQGIGALVRGEDQTDPEDIECSQLSDTCHMVIVQPLEGSPAEAAGILSGDFVVVVDGESVEGKLLDEIVAIVRGPAGTDVTLGIERGGEILEFTVTRAAITVPNVEFDVLDSGVAYLRLVTFASNADEAVHDAIGELLDGGATEIIFDLRSNPGGSLDAAVNIASEFLEDGLVLVTEAPDDRISYDVNAGGLATSDEIKLIVLVDRASASASEVVAGVLQETGRATIVGEVTFGKNTVQQQFNLDNGGAIKLTIARWLTPDGADLGDGVQPDIMVEFDPEAETDPWIDAALELLGH
ncbi:MAG: S41 family peptidase [Acidimicrobiia bacterium]|nr:S41 family peptidase [Acidimicrobiia bacterium]